MNATHATDQCLVFRGFLVKQAERHTLNLSEVEWEAMKLSEYKAQLSKPKEIREQTNEVPVEKVNSYKEAVETLPLQTKAVEGLKRLRYGLCPECSDRLHYELIRTQVIDNDPNWIPAHQRAYPSRGRGYGWRSNSGSPTRSSPSPRGRGGKRGSSPASFGIGGPYTKYGKKDSIGKVEYPSAEEAKGANKEDSKTQRKKALRAKAANFRTRIALQAQQEAQVAAIRIDEQAMSEGILKINTREPKNDHKRLERVILSEIPEESTQDDLFHAAEAQKNPEMVKEGNFDYGSDDDLDLLVEDSDLLGDEGEMETKDCNVVMFPKEFKAPEDRRYDTKRADDATQSRKDGQH